MFRCHIPLMLEAVFLQHWKEDWDREGVFRKSKSAAQTADFVRHSLVWLRLVPFHSLVVHVLQQLLPRCLYL